MPAKNNLGIQVKRRRRCPTCKKDGSTVKHTLHLHGKQVLGDKVKRRHECPHCKTRWTTYEVSRPLYKALEAIVRKANEV